jgi:site-specific recombinase XerD
VCLKVLYPWMETNGQGRLFALNHRTIQRGLASLCARLGIDGIRCSPHTARHSFSVAYLKAGGSIFDLSLLLGHSTVRHTERYLASITAEKLADVHERFSPLGSGRKGGTPKRGDS